MRPFLALVVLLINIAFGTIAQLDVPAVSDDNGGTLVTLSVEFRPGYGDTYVSVAPFAGEEFQQSVQSAVDYVRSSRNISNMDILIRSNAAGKAYLLDGPSAGAAMAIISLSLVDGKPLQQDITITGGIGADGSIIPVGGLPEKAAVASATGKKAILVPLSSAEDSAMLERISSESGIIVVHYSSIEEAYRVFITEENLPIKNISYPPVQYTSASKLPRATPNRQFSGAVSKMISTLSAEVENIRESHPSAYAYFKAKQQLAESLYEMGYTYSAGNEAFLALTKMHALEADLSDDGLAASSESTTNCLKRVENNLRNYRGPLDGYANAELRYYWARSVMDTLKLPAVTLPSRLQTAYALRQAELWCAIAEDLSTGDASGTPVNVGGLKGTDEKLLRLYFASSGDHLAKGVDAYLRGYYGAALMELSMHASEVNSTYPEKPDSYLASEWVQMMEAHSNYLESNPDYGVGSAGVIRRFAVIADRHLSDASITSTSQKNETAISTKNAITAGGDTGAGCVSSLFCDSFGLTLLMLWCIFTLVVIAHKLLHRGGGRKRWRIRTSLQR